MPPIFLQLGEYFSEVLCSTTGPPNATNCNRYSSADSHSQFRADTAHIFKCQDGTALIISFSFGSATQLLVRRNGATEHIAITLKGDVLVMQGLMQKFFEHSVLALAKSGIELAPASSAAGFTGYNFTFRYICQPHSQVPTYCEGWRELAIKDAPLTNAGRL